MTSAQSALIGNGRLLISLDAHAAVLGASWPHVDSFNQIRDLQLISATATLEGSQRFANDRLVETKLGPVTVLDEVLDDRDIWVRTVLGESHDLLIYLAPQIDGRTDDQTIFYDEHNEALLAYHRRGWILIAGEAGSAIDWQASVGSSAPSLAHDLELTGERIASHTVHGFLRLQAEAEGTRIFTCFAASREGALDHLAYIRAAETDLNRATRTAPDLTAQSRNVIRLLTSADTGGVLAGPPLQVDIASEPGYAAVWGRDASWIEFGSLAAGDFDRVRAYLNFAFRVQSPEGFWLHRHHTDYSVGSSWGMHQLDETGIILRLLACYADQADDWNFVDERRGGVIAAANFLARAIDVDGLPLPSVDLWEERESHSAYTTASFIGGLRAAAHIADRFGDLAEAADRWKQTADQLADRALTTFWSDREGRFLKAVHSRNALQLDDPTRDDLMPRSDSIKVSSTPLPSYPNWTDGPVHPVDLTADISVLGLAIPFGVIPVDDPRIIATVQRLRSHLWAEQVGGWRRYEGDTYGGGNPWPVATLWVATWEASRGNLETAEQLLDWVRTHTGPNLMIAEQVHQHTGAPIAALPMAWSHGMVLLTEAAIAGQRPWDLELDSTDKS